MAIDIKFDLAGNQEPPTIILANRNGNKLGQLNVDEKSIELIDKFNEASEITFTLYKYINGNLNNLWDKVVDFKLIYCKEWDTWFEIKVELDEATKSVKTVFCTQLGQAELSQIMLYGIEINTEDDISRDDYKIGILYDPEDSETSILSRLLKKAPHYSIDHIDGSLLNIQRSFSFDNISIYDALQEIAEEIGCLFVFNSNSDEYGMPRRTISVYDLEQNCNDCNYRGEFTDKCPKCGSTDITMGYGEDTLIFVTSDELASNGIQLVADTDSVKNCFKLEAGDDLMTATIRNRNPNGSDYIWYFSDATKEDMPQELVEKIEEYDETYRYYYNEYVSELDENLLSNYNTLVDKYLIYNEDLEKITNPIVGFASLMEAYYNTIDLGWYLKSGMMPNVKMGKTNAEEQGLLLSISLPPIVAVTNLKTVSLATANSSVLAMAKAIVNSSYKVSIGSSQLIDGRWSGYFIITNYSDEEDTYTTGIVSRSLSDYDETYIKQRIDKILSKENSDNLSIIGLFEKDYDEFCAELKKYALTPLTSFHDACQSCLDILIEQGVGSVNSWGQTESGADGNLYEKLYIPYYNKLKAIESEMEVREHEVNAVLGTYDVNGNFLADGLQTNIEKLKIQIQSTLNFEDYLGEELWLQFCTYRREDKYYNENYISDGLNNAELFERALQFYEVAENEIFKSAELQHSITATLNNLLAIPKFKPLVDSFSVGNWIRVQIDGNVYKLRLLEYEISYDDFDNISVKFSDVTKIKNGYSDLEDILSNASSMASSYDSIQRQANQGNEARNMIRQWLSEGLNASLVQIQNNTNEDVVIDNNGLIGRSYSDITGEYFPEQIRLTHNIIAFTDDNWHSVKQAIGKHKYTYFDEGENKFVDAIGYGVSSDFITAGFVSGSQIIGGNIYSDNYSVTDRTGSYLNLRDGTFSFGGGSIRFENGKLLISSPDIPTTDQITEINEEYLKTTTVYAENLKVKAANINEQLTASQINTVGLIAENISATEIEGKTITGGSLFIGDKNNTYAEITSSGVLNCSGANITGTITGSAINGGSLYISGTPQYDGYGNYITPYASIINGVLTCNSANITGTISGSTITGGSLSIRGSFGQAQITSDGVLSCSGANITGNITGSTIKGSTIGADVIYIHNEVPDWVGNGSIGTVGYVQGYSDYGRTDGIGVICGSNMCYATNAGAAISAYNESSKISVYNGGVAIIGSAIELKGTVYDASGTIVHSSDKNIKHDINHDLEKYEKLYNDLMPCSYKYNNGTSNRDHTGFIAQEVKSAIEDNGLSTQDFAAYVEHDNLSSDEFGKCGIRYGEFVALNTWQIQKLKKRVTFLEEQIEILNKKIEETKIDI